MKEVLNYVGKLVGYAKQRLELDGRNEFYARNTVLGIIGAESWDDGASVSYAGESITMLLNGLMHA